MQTLLKIISDDKGNLSSSRVFMLVVLLWFIGDWLLEFHSKGFYTLTWEKLTLLSTAFGIKTVQKFTESSGNSETDNSSFGRHRIMKPDFSIAFNKSQVNEGILSNNPKDKGGFTYKGISRIKHPAWPGWKIIDTFVETGHAPSLLNKNSNLQILVTQFYRAEYWSKIKGDLLPSQLISNEVFDSSVNMGVTIGSKFLQRTINLLNRNARLYPDISADGIIGPQTLSALNQCIRLNSEKLVYNLLNFYQASRYIQLMERDRTQEDFIGWFNRIDIIK